MTTSTPHQTAPTTLTARCPEDVLALVPVLLGFLPSESVVMLTFGAAQAFHARVDRPDRQRGGAGGRALAARAGPATSRAAGGLRHLRRGRRPHRPDRRHVARRVLRCRHRHRRDAPGRRVAVVPAAPRPRRPRRRGRPLRHLLPSVPGPRRAPRPGHPWVARRAGRQPRGGARPGRADRRAGDCGQRPVPDRRRTGRGRARRGGVGARAGRRADRRRGVPDRRRGRAAAELAPGPEDPRRRVVHVDPRDGRAARVVLDRRVPAHAAPSCSRRRPRCSAGRPGRPATAPWPGVRPISLPSATPTTR